MKRRGPVMFVTFLIILALIEYYTFVSVRYATSGLQPVARVSIFSIYITLSLIWIALFFIAPRMRGYEGNKLLTNILMAFFMGYLILKIVVGSFLLIDDVKRVFSWVTSLFYSNTEVPKLVENGMTRSQFLQKAGLLVGGTLFGTFIYGMANRYRYRVKRVQIAFENLPASFKGLKVLQISDIHSGSFNNQEAVKKGVELINRENADVIFFTGDLVNNRASEMDDYISIFQKVKAPMGVFSILGNHDYGDYVGWKSPQAREDNLNQLKNVHATLGWRLLLNENIELAKGQDKIAVIGVENTSAKGFHSYGDLPKAYAGIENIPFKILLSHDPSHWDSEVRTAFKDIDLTLSGHTHGMQFGVDLSWFKWSPVQYMYKQWAGLYQEGKQFIYVNKGFGFLGYPGRVGMLPEITMIELV